MYPAARSAFPYLVLLLCFAALSWAVSFGTLPKADFAFNNGDEVKTVDPAKATGNPEGRIIFALFEGLYRHHPQGYELDAQGNVVRLPTPDADGNVPLETIPAAAAGCDISEDGTHYTFRIRKTGRWSDGSPVTAHDFAWSWQRMLHPETASRYAYQLYYVIGAQQYNEARTEEGDRVEVERPGRLRSEQPFPRGPLERGVLKKILKPAAAESGGSEPGSTESRDEWIFVVDVKPETETGVQWNEPGRTRAFTLDPLKVGRTGAEWPGSLERAQQLLPDFESTVGIQATDDHTLQVRLKNRTPFFLDLTAFYPLFPVNRQCVETHGVPDWTKPENIVCNGPYLLQFRRIRDRVRLAKNPLYHAADSVQIETIDAMAVKSETTGLNMYLNGQLDWATTVPTPIIPELQKRDDFISAPALITYFYRLNVTRPPLDDVHVRRAMNMAIDKRLICEKVAKAGQQPARSFVPPGLDEYRSPQSAAFDVQAARAELAKSRYRREGIPLPKIQILYNTNEGHRAIAEVIQQQWKNNLGIDVELKNSEWASFLDAVHTLNYVVARAGWIGDYPDPNTFLDMWVTGGDNNETGWSNPQYDALIQQAAAEPDAQRRLELLQEAEAILMDEMPIIPIYFYVTINMVKPNVTGFYANIQDLHPLHLLRIEKEE